MLLLTMSETTNINQTDPEKEAQTQHVMSTALRNLTVVIDQLQTLEDSRVESVLTDLTNAKADLEKQIA